MYTCVCTWAIQAARAIQSLCWAPYHSKRNPAALTRAAKPHITTYEVHVHVLRTSNIIHSTDEERTAWFCADGTRLSLFLSICLILGPLIYVVSYYSVLPTAYILCPGRAKELAKARLLPESLVHNTRAGALLVRRHGQSYCSPHHMFRHIAICVAERGNDAAVWLHFEQRRQGCAQLLWFPGLDC